MSNEVQMVFSMGMLGLIAIFGVLLARYNLKQIAIINEAARERRKNRG